jgi:hypothetical protein
MHEVLQCRLTYHPSRLPMPRTHLFRDMRWGLEKYRGQHSENREHCSSLRNLALNPDLRPNAWALVTFPGPFSGLGDLWQSSAPANSVPYALWESCEEISQWFFPQIRCPFIPLIFHIWVPWQKGEVLLRHHKGVYILKYSAGLGFGKMFN